METKIVDGAAAESVVRKYLEAQYKKKLKDVAFSKTWKSTAGSKEVWEIQGTVKWKKGRFTSQKRLFNYQVDPEQGNIIVLSTWL